MKSGKYRDYEGDIVEIRSGEFRFLTFNNQPIEPIPDKFSPISPEGLRSLKLRPIESTLVQTILDRYEA